MKRFKCTKCRLIIRDGQQKEDGSCLSDWCKGKMKEMKEPRIDGFVPDIAMVFSYKGSTYRCTLWYKKISLTLPEKHEDEQDWYFDFKTEFFLKNHPEYWHEYKLIPCLREEATHVSGTSICGCIASIEDIECDGTYVEWSKEFIDDQRSSAINTATNENRRLQFGFDTYSNISWRYIEQSKVFEKYPFIREEWENLKDGESKYIIFNHTRFDLNRNFKEERKTLDKGSPVRIKTGELKEEYR